jgi:hypothetical protein
MFGRANKRWGNIGRSKAAFWQDHQKLGQLKTIQQANDWTSKNDFYKQRTYFLQYHFPLGQTINKA